MTIQERLARAKAGDVVKPTSVLSSSAPKNNLSVTERLNIAKQVPVPSAPKQAEPSTLDRIGLATKSGVGSGVSGSLGALQKVLQWSYEKALPEEFYNKVFSSRDANAEAREEGTAKLREQYPNAILPKKSVGTVNPQEINRQSQADLARATEGASGVGEFALKGLSSVANMGTGAVTSAVTGIPFTAVMGLQAGGGAALSAEAQGKTLDQQVMYGGLTGLAVGAIEALGGIGASKALAPAKAKVAAALLSKLPEGVLRWAATTGAKTFGRILGSGFSEALEEGIEYNTDRWLQKLVLDEEVPFDVKEMAYQSLLGGTVGGLFGVANVGTEALRNRIENAKQAQTIGAETQTAPNIPTTPPQSTQADVNVQTDNLAPLEQLGQQMATESVAKPTSEKVYYHATNADFDTFEHQDKRANGANLGRGFYFTQNADMASNYGKNVKTAKLNIEKPLIAGKPQYEVDTNGINEIIDKLGDIEDSDLQYSGYSTLGELYDSKDFSDLSIIGDVANRLDKYQLPDFYKMVKEKYGYDGVVSKDETIVFSNDQIIPTETIANNATTQNVQSVQPTLPEGVGAMSKSYEYVPKKTEVLTNTLSNTDMLTNKQKDIVNSAFTEQDFTFESVSEKESVEQARERLNLDFSGEVQDLGNPTRSFKDAADVDTSMAILETYAKQGAETGDYTDFANWAKNVYEKSHESATSLQALAKYSRTPEGKVLEAQQEISKRERKLTTTEVNGKQVKNKRGRDIEGDTETAKSIIKDIADGKDVSEKSKRLKKVKLQDLVDLYASGKYTDDAITDLVKAQYGVPTLTAEDVRNIYEYAKLEAETTDDYQKRVYKYKQSEIIASRMTSTFGEKVLMTRRLAMLLNPKTVISRNAGGNVVFGTAEIIKDAPGTAIDYLVSKKTGKRTTSLNLYETAKAQGKGAKKAVTEIAKDVKLGVDTSPTRHELPTAKTFESKFGRGAEDLLNVLMQFGDRPFFEGTYEARTKELQRLGYDINSEDVQSHVFNYALERVFQNDSELSKKASRIRKSFGLFGEITMPFVQTPTNIFDKLLDYSPYGFARSIKLAGTVSDSVWSQKRFVDTLARAFTGTGVLLFGYFGFLKGFLTGSKRDENEKVIGAEQRAGSQEYSVVVDGKSYTYDWAAPVGALLAMGANMAQAGVNKDSVVSMLAATTKAGIDVMFGQSHLQGLSELFGKENFSEGLQGIMMGLPASFIPTGFQQIARLIDDTQRDTFDKDPVMRMLKRMAVKTPFASKLLPPKIDPTGEEAKQFQGRSTASNAFESFISPGYIGENVQNAVDEELYDLYSRTGDTDVLPRWSAYTSKADLKFSVGGQAYEMTDKEWTQYQKTLGKETYSNVDKLMKTSDYRKASDADKSDMIRDIISEATEKAKREAVEARGDMFLNKAGRERVQEYNKAGLNDKQAYELYNKIQSLEPKDGKKTVSQTQKLDVILSSNHSAKTKAGVVATLYDNSLLHKLDSHSTLLNIYKSTKDTTYINMTVPDKFSESKTEYVLTDGEKALYEKTFVDFMNKQGKPAPIGSLKAEQNRLKKLIGFAKDRARMEVIKSRRK